MARAEAPGGGEITLLGEGFGRLAVVRIGDRVARILQRSDTKLRAQVPAKSKGGPVTVQVGPERRACGELRIVGAGH
jgi:hypothetical protein